jgi:hypothetical protein
MVVQKLKIRTVLVYASSNFPQLYYVTYTDAKAHDGLQLTSRGTSIYGVSHETQHVKEA